MDLPATQFIEDDDFASTQSYSNNDNEKILVATLSIKNVSHSIYSGTTTVGRLPTHNIVINDETVSKNHAEIEAESCERAIFIKDLGSSNKTRINNSKLKPHAAYQIKDNDMLTFGKIIGTFKVCNVEESFVSHPPQVDKNKSVIPDTPDSSMNASISDISAIPGTQADDSSFQHPKLPSRFLIINNEPKSPIIEAFNVNDLPLPLVNDKSKENAIVEVDTQRYSIGDTKEITDNSIYNATTQKASTVEQSDDADEDIFKIKTQVPSNQEEIINDLENVGTQPFEVKKSDSAKNLLHDVSIYSAETQKVEAETSKSRKSLSAKLSDVSFYSAETQKAIPEASADESIENMETQQYEKSDQDKRKYDDFSIYSAKIQKIIPEGSIEEILEDLETQPFITEKPEIFNTPKVPIRFSTKLKSASKSMSKVSIENADTQQFEKIDSCDLSSPTFPSIENMETQSFEDKKSDKFETSNVSLKSSNQSLNTSNGQKSIISLENANATSKVPQYLIEEDVETQRFEDDKSNKDIETPKSSTKKSVKVTLVSQSVLDVSIENIKTQKFEDDKSDELSTPKKPIIKSVRTPQIQKLTLDIPVENMETQKFEDEKFHDFATPSRPSRKSSDKSLNTPEIQKTASHAIADETLDDLKSQFFEKEKSNVNNRKSTIELFEDIETQKVEETQEFDVRKSNRLQTLSSFGRKYSSKFAESISKKSECEENVETQPFVPNKSIKFIDETIDDLETQSFVSNQSVDHTPTSKGEKVDESTNEFSKQKHYESLVNKSVDEIEKCKTTNNSINKDSKANNSTIDESNVLKKVDKVIQEKSIDNEEDDEEEFYSQNLINEDASECMPKEWSDEDETVTTNKNILEHSKKENVHESKKEQEKSLQQQNQSKVDGDFETDEDNIFSSSISKDNKTKGSNVEDEHNSETDEEGIFSSHLSTETEKNKTVDKANQEYSKQIDEESSSETDEEGIFTNQLSNDNGKSINKSKKFISKSSSSETDEEGVFSCHLSKEDEHEKSTNIDKSRKLENESFNSKPDKEDIFTNQSATSDLHEKSTTKSDQITSKKSEDKFSNSETDEDQFSLRFSKDGNTTVDTDGEIKNQSFNKNKSMTNSVLTKQINESDKMVLSSDPEEDLFEEYEVKEEKTLHQPAKETLNESESKDVSASKVGIVFLNFKKFSKKSFITNNKEDKDSNELKSMQLVNTKAAETENMSLEPTQVINLDFMSPPRNHKFNKIDDQAPTSITSTCSSQISSANRKSDFWISTNIALKSRKNAIEKSTAEVDDLELAPTQKIKTERLQPVKTGKSISLAEDGYLAITQLTPCKKNIAVRTTLSAEDIQMEPTQKMMQTELEPTQKIKDTELEPTQRITDTELEPTQKMADNALEPTQIIQETEIEPTQVVSLKKSQALDIDLELAPTQKINIETQSLKPMLVPTTPVVVRAETRMSMNSSKRQFKEDEIIKSTKKVKISSHQSIRLDLDSTIEQDLNKLFEGPEEQKIVEDSMLLTQQLENILESSQVDDSPKISPNIVPSPTLGSRRSQGRRKCRRITDQLNKSVALISSNMQEEEVEKLKSKSINQDDSIEKNLNQLFDNSINHMEVIDSDDMMMTQQLTNILASQDNDESKPEKTSEEKKNSPDKKNQLNISLNTPSGRSKNKSRISRLSTDSKTVHNRKSAVQASMSNKSKSTMSETDSIKESQDVFFANLKSKRKNNVIDSQTSDDDESQNHYLANLKSNRNRSIMESQSTENEDAMDQLSSTEDSKTISLLQSKNRPTSDCQSDAEDTLERSLSNCSRSSSKKRLSLSLKNVDLNSSISSLHSDCDVGSKLSTRSYSSILRKSSQTKSSGQRKSTKTSVSNERVQARGIRGFSTDLEPISDEELVSANSDIEEQSSRKQVCNQTSSNNFKSDNDELEPFSQISIISTLSQLSFANDDSDDDFLKNMPAIKVAGTADCPPTNSQLAASSDHEDLESIFSGEIKVPTKYNWYAKKRYDLIYKNVKLDDTTKDNDEDNEANDYKRTLKADEQPTAIGPTVEEVLAQIKSSKSARIQHKTKGEKEQKVKGSNDEINTCSSRSLHRSSQTLSSFENSPRSSVNRLSSSFSQNKSQFAESDDDSDDDNLISIIPKYKPLRPLNIRAELAAALAAVHDEDSDQEFEVLRQKCAKTLAVQSTSSAPSSIKQKEQEKLPPNKRLSNYSPPLSRRRGRQRKNSTVKTPTTTATKRMSNNTSKIVTNESGSKQVKRRSKANASGTAAADQDTFIFQVSGSVANQSTRPKTQTQTQTPMAKMTPQIPSEDDHDATSCENQLTKSTTSHAAELANRQLKLQELSVLISPLRERFLNNKNTTDTIKSKQSDVNEKLDVVKQLAAASVSATSNSSLDKKVGKVSKTLDSYVLLEKQNSINNSSFNRVLEGKIASIGKSTKLDSKATRSKTVATANAAKSTWLVSASKENIVEDSDDEIMETLQKKTRTVKTRTPTDVKIITDKVSRSSATIEKKTGAKVAKKVSKIVSSIESTSDSEFETEFTSRVTRHQSTKNDCTMKSKNSKNITVKTTRNTRARAAKTYVEISDSKQSQNSEISINTKNTRARSAKNVSYNKSTADNAAKVNTKNKKVAATEILGSNTEKSDSQQSQSKVSKIAVDTKSLQTASAKTKSSNKLENSNSNVTVSTARPRRGRNLTESSSVQSEKSESSVGKTVKSSKNTRTRNARNKSIEKSEATVVVRTTRSRQIKPDNKYANENSVISVSTDEGDVVAEKSNSIDKKGKNTHCTKQKSKKRAAASEVIDIGSELSSVESQEVAEILTNVENIKCSRPRRERAAKNSTTYTADEKAPTQAKRARLDSKSKSEAASKRYSTDDSENEIFIQTAPRSRRKRTANPLPIDTAAPKRRRSLTQMQSHNVMFLEKASEAHFDIVKKLGGSETKQYKDCSVLIANKVQTTRNFLCSVARGVPIVSVSWLIDSEKANTFLNLEDYILKDQTAENRYNFQLKDSLKKAKNKKLLTGYTLLLTPHFQPSTAELKEIIIANGGKTLVRPPIRWSPKTIVIANKEDLSSAKKLMTKAPKSVTVHSTDFILTAILRQEINLEEFKLSI